MRLFHRAPGEHGEAERRHVGMAAKGLDERGRGKKEPNSTVVCPFSASGQERVPKGGGWQIEESRV